MNGVYIHSASAFIGDPNADIGFLKKEAGRHTDQNFRRVNRFILLSLIGALQCVGRNAVDEDTAVYLTTENGNLEETADVLDEIYADRSLPKPFGFINTMSNTAAFYLARTLGIRGRNVTVSSRRFSFERGLELLSVDFAAGTEKSALIGGVDESPLFRGGSGETAGRGWRMVDGSGWFYVKAEQKGACGAFTEAVTFQDGSSCIQWMKGRPPASVIAFGALIGDDEAAALRDASRSSAVFDYLRGHGYSDSAAACGASLFMMRFQTGTLLHVNKNELGNFTVIEIERY